jgi:type IV pilus assembly protein PilM
VFLKTKCSPIGIDVGTDSLKMVQLELVGAELRLSAAGSYPMPPEAKTDPSVRAAATVEGIRQLLGTGGFKGRRAVTCLPSVDVEIFHVRVAPVPEEQLPGALVLEIQPKVQFDAGTAVMRHMKVGEVYQGGEPRHEVIVMLAPRPAVQAHLDLMRRLRLDVTGVQIAGCAMLECFKRLMRRREDNQTCHFFVDIGATFTHAVIAHGTTVMFAKKIEIGGDDFSTAYAKAAGLSFGDAKLNRSQQTSPMAMSARAGGERGGDGGASAEVGEAPGAIGQAIAGEVDRLGRELAMCVRYYGSVFHGSQVQRLIFLGGEANQHQLCQQIAQRLGISAQIGDPFARVLRGDNGIDASIERDGPQPAWAVAMGCALVEVNQGS